MEGLKKSLERAFEENEIDKKKKKKPKDELSLGFFFHQFHFLQAMNVGEIMVFRNQFFVCADNRTQSKYDSKIALKVRR